MTIRKAVLLSACLFSIALSANAAAQSGDGSLRGIVNDEQGAAMPGVTVTAPSPQAIAPAVAVTDASGEYRLTNLAPGTYTLTMELAGFSTVKRAGVVLRASANFQVEPVVMRVGGLEESITVSGRSPMVEVSNPTTVMNVDAEFQKAVP